ncbi:hypothetical protein XFF6970_190003 [Xanthomonas citri pv. fuscans]|nr:hypothetical protein XFF6970_190003 [Xanthomonas citri pv. fuscans]
MCGLRMLTGCVIADGNVGGDVAASVWEARPCLLHRVVRLVQPRDVLGLDRIPDDGFAQQVAGEGDIRIGEQPAATPTLGQIAQQPIYNTHKGLPRLRRKGRCVLLARRVRGVVCR